jgi:hypothetical protein
MPGKALGSGQSGGEIIGEIRINSVNVVNKVILF